MEQWNEKQDVDKYTYSLKEIMERQYLMSKVKVQLKEMGLELDNSVEELDMNIVSRVIDEVILADSEEYEKEGRDNFVKSQSTILFRMLNAVIKDIKKKLRKNTRSYQFNENNYRFFANLLNMYEDNNHNCKDLQEENFEMLDDDFLEPFLHEGLLDLARNDTTILQEEEVNREWKLLFNPDFKEILELLNSLKLSVEYYVGEIIPKDKNMDALNKIKDILIKCEEEIVTIAKERIEPLNAIDEEKAMKKLLAPAISIIDSALRSKRAKKGWEKRKSKKKNNK